MSKIITLEETRQEFIDRGYIPLFKEYRYAREKLLAETKEGYKVVICLNHLKNGKTPSEFDTRNPYTIENIRLWLKLNNVNYELISTEYKNCDDKLILLCKEHGEFRINWDHLKQGKGCAKCGMKQSHDKQKLTLEEVKKRVSSINKDIEILSDAYMNAKTKLKLRCKVCGCQWKTRHTYLFKGCGCPKCAKLRMTGENHFNWKGGISPLNEYLRHKICQWKKDSFIKSHYKCEITGSTKELVIHHHYSFAYIIQETVNTLNLPIYDEVNKYTDIELKQIEELCLGLHCKYGLGICLTENIHKEFHSIYGYGDNTKEQYNEFKKLKSQQINKKENKAS